MLSQFNKKSSTISRMSNYQENTREISPKEKAIKRLNSIKALEKNADFNEYFVKTLEEWSSKKLVELSRDLGEDDRITRKKLIAYQTSCEVLELMKNDKTSAERTISVKDRV
jgi:hypothetical protein